MKFPISNVLLRIGKCLPGIVKSIIAEVQAAKAAGSDGGKTVTGAEVVAIVGLVFEKLATEVLPVVLKANSLTEADVADSV